MARSSKSKIPTIGEYKDGLCITGSAPSKRYTCTICGFIYSTKKWAEKCEAWCKKYKSCNLDITKQAIQP